MAAVVAAPTAAEAAATMRLDMPRALPVIERRGTNKSPSYISLLTTWRSEGQSHLVLFRTRLDAPPMWGASAGQS